MAKQTMRSASSDHRIKIVPYELDNVVPVSASTFTTTQVIFGHGEIIENIQNGDMDAWTVNVQKGISNMLFLKPTITGSNTNMTVVTNRHTYYFHLMSHKARSRNQNDTTYAIRFTYPEENREHMLANLHFNQQQRHAILNAKKNPQNYNWNYSFSGSHTIMPIHVFDDGRFTYMELQPNQPTPAIFAVDNKSGKEAVVNYRVRGRYLIVQQISPQFTLREGSSAIASVFNNRYIKRLRHSRV
jgi:type IV secretion system protein VirB9